MKSKIIKEEKNPFLERAEIVLEIESKVAPTTEEVKSAIKKDGELVVVKKIHTNFGKHIFIAEVFVYDSIEAKERIETVPKKIRKKMEEEKKAAVEADKKADAQKEEPASEGGAEASEPVSEKEEAESSEKSQSEDSGEKEEKKTDGEKTE